MIVQTQIPRWALPLIPPRRYKGAKGGRSGGKSHFFAEQVVAKMAGDPHFKVIGIREIQKDLRHSVKALVESKIEKLGVGHLFDIQRAEILHRKGPGLMAFTGMQEHNADSVKGLESFDLGFVDEANSISKRSLELLTPTFRKEGSELWFGWNPQHDNDPIDAFFRENQGDPDFVCEHVSIRDNPFVSDTGWKEYVRAKRRANESEDPNAWALFEHIWHGAYNLRSDAIIFSGRWSVTEFKPLPSWDGPYYGCDFGFAQDPTVFSEWYIHDNQLWCRRDCGQVELDIDDMGAFADRHMPGMREHTIRADSARPEVISYGKRHGFPRMTGVEKWKGSVEDGIAFMKSFDRINIHPDAKGLQDEAKAYRYKVNKAGDILPTVEDADNHYWDAGRYALAPLIRRKSGGFAVL